MGAAEVLEGRRGVDVVDGAVLVVVEAVLVVGVPMDGVVVALVKIVKWMETMKTWATATVLASAATLMAVARGQEVISARPVC